MSFRPFTSESYCRGRPAGGVAGRAERGRPASHRRPSAFTTGMRRHRAAPPRASCWPGWRPDRRRLAAVTIAPTSADRAVADRGRRDASDGGSAIRSSRSGICCCCREGATGASLPARHARHGAVGDLGGASSAARSASRNSTRPGVLRAGRLHRGVFAHAGGGRANRSRRLSDVEWAAVAQSLADLLPTLRTASAPTTDTGGTATQAAILHRHLPDHRAQA